MAGKDIDYHANAIKSICRRLDWPKAIGGRYAALIDSAASQRTLSSIKSVAELFFDAGIAANTNVNKDIFSGIARIKSYLSGEYSSPKIYIFKSCINLIREIKSYFWQAGDNPQKKDDHALDELRYYIMSRPQGKNISHEKGAIELDKEKLMRRIRRRR